MFKEIERQFDILVQQNKQNTNVIIFNKIHEEVEKTAYTSIHKQLRFKRHFHDIEEFYLLTKQDSKQLKQTVFDFLVLLKEYQDKIDVLKFDFTAYFIEELPAIVRKSDRLKIIVDELFEYIKSFEFDECIRLFVIFKKLGEGENIPLKFNDFKIANLVRKIIKQGKKSQFPNKFVIEINEILNWDVFKNKEYYGSDLFRAKSNLKLALINYSEGDELNKILKFQFEEADGVGSIINEVLSESIVNNVSWNKLLFHFSTATSAKPTVKFTKYSDSLINEISINNYRMIVHQWLVQVTNKRIPLYDMNHEEHYYQYNEYQETAFLTTTNTRTIKGIVWSLQRFHDAETLRILSDLALKCYHKIPGVGAMAQALGNACIYVLAQSKGLNGISYLTRLKLRVTQNNTKKLIQKYIDEKAAKLKLLPSQIDEIAVLDYKFSDGQRSDTFDEYKLVSKITAIGKITLQWIKADGKLQKTVAAFVKKSKTWSDKLKSIKASNKQAAQSLTAQRDRLDNMFLENRRWNKEDFEKHYLTHGLMGFISKRLVWLFDDKAVIWHEGGFKTNQNQPVLLSDSTKISLWHPIFSSSKEIITWRDFLDDNQIKQPLKQVYREIYVLTDAEIKTNTYSNRMAAHILKQHQFNALAKIRNWKYALSGCFDNGGAGELASKEIPAYDLFAEFWINELTDVESYNDSGIWDYIATDQVKFLNQEGDAIELAQIPALVFSEIMRDCDLFVGVASVGNDPQWQDNGGERQYYDYWNDYSFGHLSELAKTRKIVLERLIPRLKIANQLSIKDKFLQVKGTRHTYNIHIGSGNILIQPHNKYLCIVAGRKSRAVDNIFLPFEGDRGLSMVLSKAFMLAADNKIKDKTILSQL